MGRNVLPTLAVTLTVAGGAFCAACGESGGTPARVAPVSEEAHEVIGTRAAGLDAGSEVGARFDIHRGRYFMLGLNFIQNRRDADAIIDRVEVVPKGTEVDVTHARVWVIPKDVRKALPGGDPEWPPSGYPIVPKLPERNVTVPPRRTAQIVFGVASRASVGTTVSLVAMRVRFRQGGVHYVWTLPLPVEMKTVP